jgi:general secretion pathway protein D
MRAPVLLFTCTLCLLPTLAPYATHAAQPRPRPALEPGPETALAGQLELARLVDIAAQRLGLNIDYDAAALRGTVTLRIGAAIADDELWLLTNRLLATRGFTTVRMPGKDAFSVVRLQDASGLARVLGPDAPPTTGLEPETGLVAGFQSLVVRVQHRPTREIVDALGRAVSKPGGSVAAIGDAGLVLISDLTARLDQTMDLLRVLDVPGPMIAVEEVAASHLAGPALATLVTQVAARREAASGTKLPGDVIPSPHGGTVLIIAPAEDMGTWRALVNMLDRRESVTSHTYAPRHFLARDVARIIEEAVRDTAGRPPEDRWRLVVDDLTGTLIVTATPSQHEAIMTLLERLDSAPQAARRPMQSFVIRNRSVGEIVRILEQLMQAGVLDAEDVAASGTPTPDQRTEREVVPGSPAAVSSTPQTPVGDEIPPERRHTASRITVSQRPLLLTADEGTNTLIALGEPRLLAQVATLLETLDVRQPQVMLEVLLLSLTEGQALTLGVELEQLHITGDLRIRLSSLFGLSTRGPGDTRVVGDGTGFTGVVLSPGDFAVVLRALQTINQGRSLSMPKLLVANNQSAVLNSVLQQPFTTINASPTVATTSFGGTQDAGTTVSIRPQIAEGDHLNLEYSVALSSFVGSPPVAGLPPPRQQNSVQSMATIPDGYTVVVGGIELEAKAHAISQVPLLGSIPLLGEAFKSRSHSSNRSRFYVFIRANVLRGRGFEDLRYISDSAVAGTGGLINDGWPAVEPRIIR